MLKEKLYEGLKQVETIASASKIARMLSNPYKYLNAILFRELIYKRKRKEKEVRAQTFLGSEMTLLLPSSTDIYLTGGKSHDSEIRLAKFLISNLNEQDVFFDVGAHYGYFSMLASKLVGQLGKVYSFEASPKTYEILVKNASDCANVISSNLAVSDSSSFLEFYEFPNLYSEYNTLDVDQFKNESWFTNSKPTAVKIKSVTLDKFVEQELVKPQIIKIDVEGAEYQVINGSRGYLEENAPLIVMEFLSEKRGNEAHLNAEKLLRSLGYDSYIIDRKGKIDQVKNIADFLESQDVESDNIVFRKDKAEFALKSHENPRTNRA